jgi:hypothetical protein
MIGPKNPGRSFLLLSERLQLWRPKKQPAAFWAKPLTTCKTMNAILAYTPLVKSACNWGPGINLDNIDRHPRELACYKAYKTKNPFRSVARKYLTQ